MAKAAPKAAVIGEASKEATIPLELVFWVAEENGEYVVGSPGNEAEFSGEINDALKFADVVSVHNFMSYLNFAQYEAVEHSMAAV